MTRLRLRALLVLAVALVALGVPATSGGALDAPPAPSVSGPPATWPDVALEAEAYLLVEAATGQVLVAHRAEELRPVASTVKVLTALSVLERADLDEEVVVGDEVVGIPGSGADLEPGDTWTVAELLDALISRSGNDAAEALAVHVGGDVATFVEMMAADAAALGLGERPLVSPSGLDDANRLSALDLATIARAALADERLRPYFARPRVALPGQGLVESRNELLERYPEATGLKTGFTNAAGNSLVASAARDGRELVAVVLGSGEDPARFEAAIALLELGFTGFAPREVGTVLEYRLAGGVARIEVPTTPVSVPAGTTASLGLELSARPPDAAPVVPVRVGDDVLGELQAVLEIDRDDGGDAALGRAAADGVYAALRAGAAAGVLR